MNADLFVRIGAALYGAQFRRALARALDVSERTVSRWLACDNPIPEGVWDDLAALLRDQRAGHAELLRALRRR